MSTSDLIATELFQDKSLLCVYRKSVTYSETLPDRAVKLFSFVALSALSAYVFLKDDGLFPVEVKSVSNWMAMGFNYSITILGFLVAGFTIFATMTKVEIFIALTIARHKEKDVSQIKFIFYSFLRVFINHIVLLFFCVMTTMLKDSANIYLNALSFSQADIISIKKMSVSIIFPVLGLLVVSAVLQLKTFVWNLYQSIIVAIAGAVTLHEIDKGKR